MKITQQVLHSLNIVRLKNIVDLNIDFDGSPITAILGPNGNGKSTILHALACAFEPVLDGENYKFSSFFLPNTDALWAGSEMSINYSYREDAEYYEKEDKGYSKVKDRWAPRYNARPKRDVYYIGIDKCVPMIESEKRQAKVNYSTTVINEGVVEEILEKASYVLNKVYTAFNKHSTAKRAFIGVEADGIKYSALSMSAGEQKIFFILEKVFRAKKNSLILIDELDLLLHDDAMRKLIEVVYERLESKNIQLIFTTHRESVLDMSDKVNIRHILTKNNKTLCFNETKPDAIKRLTGTQPKPVEIFVEDELAYAIVQKIASRLKMAKCLSIQLYGAAINCFTVAGGLIIGGSDCNDMLFVIDGDEYVTADEKQERVNKVITGHDEKSVNGRALALESIVQFNLPPKTSPERYLHSLLISIDVDALDEENAEIVEAAKDIVVVNDDHKYIDDLIYRLGLDKKVGLSKIVNLVCCVPEWDFYVSQVHEWLSVKSLELTEV